MKKILLNWLASEKGDQALEFIDQTIHKNIVLAFSFRLVVTAVDWSILAIRHIFWTPKGTHIALIKAGVAFGVGKILGHDVLAILSFDVPDIPDLPDPEIVIESAQQRFSEWIDGLSISDIPDPAAIMASIGQAIHTWVQGLSLERTTTYIKSLVNRQNLLDAMFWGNVAATYLHAKNECRKMWKKAKRKAKKRTKKG